MKNFIILINVALFIFIQNSHSNLMELNSTLSEEKSKDCILTIPKTGTNLLIKCLKLIKAKYGDDPLAGLINGDPIWRIIIQLDLPFLKSIV